MAAGDEAHAPAALEEDPDTEPEDSPKAAPPCSGAVLGLLQASKVWIASKTEVWQLATVSRAAGDELHVVAVESGEESAVASHEAHAFDASHEADLDDLATMNMLHEARPTMPAAPREQRSPEDPRWAGEPSKGSAGRVLSRRRS
jgi:hypothetical protein